MRHKHTADVTYNSIINASQPFLLVFVPLLSDDLPDLQEVKEEAVPTAPPVYQVEVGVSHQERHTQASQPPDTRWLTQLAHIATGPQSPLLQDCPHSR